MTANIGLLPKDDAPLSADAEVVLRKVYEIFDRTNRPAGVTRVAVDLKGSVFGVPELLNSGELAPYVTTTRTSSEELVSPTLRAALKLWKVHDLEDVWAVYAACYDQLVEDDQPLDFSKLVLPAEDVLRLSHLLSREPFVTVLPGATPTFRINRSVLNAPDLGAYLRLKNGVPVPSSPAAPLRAPSRIEAISLTGVRSFESATLAGLGNLTVFAGPNEAGKSNIIKAIEFCKKTAAQGFAKTREDLPRLRRATSGSVQFEIKIALRTTDQKAWLYSLRQTSPGGFLGESMSELAEAGPIDFAAGVPMPWKVRLEMNGAVVRMFDDNGNNTLLKIQEGESILASLQDIELFKSLIALRGSLGSWSVFHLEPTALIEASSPNASGALGRDGGNLATALLSLAQRDRAAYEEVAKAFYALLPETEKLESEAGLTGAAQLTLRERGLTDPLAQRDFSDGMLRILAMLVLAFDPDPPSLVVIEEPENGLYPRLIEAMVEILRQLATRTQVFVTTHSVTLLNRLKPEEVVLVYRQDHSSHFQRVESRADIKAFLPRMGIGTQMLIGNLEDVS